MMPRLALIGLLVSTILVGCGGSTSGGSPTAPTTSATTPPTSPPASPLPPTPSPALPPSSTGNCADAFIVPAGTYRVAQGVLAATIDGTPWTAACIGVARPAGTGTIVLGFDRTPADVVATQYRLSFVSLTIGLTEPGSLRTSTTAIPSASMIGLQESLTVAGTWGWQFFPPGPGRAQSLEFGRDGALSVTTMTDGLLVGTFSYVSGVTAGNLPNGDRARTLTNGRFNLTY